MGEARTQFDRIGITGYPESHHLISDEETIRAMFVKAEMATDIVSQLCFDPATIAWWIGAVRARGVRLPIWIGLPGCVDYAKLVRISMKIGMAESARFLSHQRGWVSRLLTRQFKPDQAARRPRAGRSRSPTPASPASTSTRSTRWVGRSAGGAGRSIV